MRQVIYRRFVGRKAIARLFLVALFVLNCKKFNLLPVAKYRLAPAKLIAPPLPVRPVVSFLPIDHILGYDSVAFTGSRSSDQQLQIIAADVVKSLVPEQRVFVGCARGIDAVVRKHCEWAQVFSVASGQWGTGAAAFARRSVAMLEALQASSPSCLLVAFPVGNVPPGLKPSKYWISASGCGTWGTVAVAVGRGIPCLVLSKYTPGYSWGFKHFAGDWWFFAGKTFEAEPEPEAKQLSLFF